MKSNNILAALSFLNVALLSYDEWLRVGMALHTEGYPCSIWENWSRNDSRYHPGECERKWQSFHNSGSPVAGGTILKMALERGWSPSRAADSPDQSKPSACLEWDATIPADIDDVPSPSAASEAASVEDLVTYLSLLFKPDDLVGYVTESRQNADGKWVPHQGAYDRTARQLIDTLKRHPNDLGATVGDWSEAAGAWIRFNPLDGKGVKNENVTGFNFTLVESDTLPIQEQDRLYRELQLPIAALVYSGGKSLHAIVHIDAKNAVEYRERVDYLYQFLEKHGVAIDKQNRNPSRLSRLPGATRNGRRQALMGTNLGKHSWDEWRAFVDSSGQDTFPTDNASTAMEDGLPAMLSLSDYMDNPPPLPEELIEGILRMGHKMLISGSSKAGKSFLLDELCIAIAEGTKWLGFSCRQGRVLYINFEIDDASVVHRYIDIYDKLGIEQRNAQNIVIWNLRGRARPLDELAPLLINRLRKEEPFVAIIFDPIYKVITGDENNASDMGAFCNLFDRISMELGCAVIYCHHHSKGLQGAKRAMDRASGSGVFARDPDAQLDIIQLSLREDQIRSDGATAWQMESNLREFSNIQPVKFWFEYPIHRLDTTGELADAIPEGSPLHNLTKSSKRTSAKKRKNSLDDAFDACAKSGAARLNEMAAYSDVSSKTIRRYITDAPEEYTVKRGIVTRKL